MSLFVDYNEQGFCVIPLENGKPTIKWIEYQKELPTYDDVSKWKGSEYALVCGKVSGVVALDIDDDEVVSFIEGVIGKSPVAKFGTKGYTGFYSYNGEQNHVWKQNGKVICELRSDKMLVTIPPSKHRNNKDKYVWQGTGLGSVQLPSLPSYFIDVMNARFPKPAYNRTEYKLPIIEREISYFEAEKMLAYINADCSRDEWVQIGMAIKDEFGDAANDLWHSWSSKSSKYNYKDAQNAWRSFGDGAITIGTLIYFAQNAGWLFQKEKSQEIEIDLSYLRKAKDNTDFLANIPNGLVKDVYNWILATSIDPQPLLALPAALCAVGTIKGHFYREKHNLRTNLMAIGLLPAGFGKDHARKCVANIFNQAEIKNRLSGSPSSAQALISALHYDGGVKLIQIDEIGRMLESIKGKNASSYQKDILTEIMMLFSAASTYYHGREYANRKENPVKSIEQPCLSVYGVTVPENLYENITSREAIDGFLARWIIFKSDNVSDDNDDFLDNSIVPANILNAIKLIIGSADIYGGINPFNVPYTCDAELYQKSLRKEYKQKMIDAVNSKTGLNAIYSRCWEHTVKLALTVCNNQIITLADLEWASSVVNYSTSQIIDIAQNHISDGEFDKDCKFVFSKIKEVGKISHSDLYRKTQKFKAKEFTDILQSLLDKDKIGFEEDKSNNNKNQKLYFCI